MKQLIMLVLVFCLLGCIENTPKNDLNHTKLQECYNDSSVYKEGVCVYEKAIKLHDIAMCDYYPSGKELVCYRGAHASFCDYNFYNTSDCVNAVQSYFDEEVIYSAISTNNSDKCEKIAGINTNPENEDRIGQMLHSTVRTSVGCKYLVNHSNNISIPFEAISPLYRCFEITNNGGYMREIYHPANEFDVSDCYLFMGIVFEKQELCNNTRLSDKSLCMNISGLAINGFNETDCKEYNSTGICGGGYYNHILPIEHSKALRKLIEIPLNKTIPFGDYISPSEEGINLFYDTINLLIEDLHKNPNIYNKYKDVFYDAFGRMKRATVFGYDLEEYYYDYALMHLDESICYTRVECAPCQLDCVAKIRATKKYLNSKPS